MENMMSKNLFCEKKKKKKKKKLPVIYVTIWYYLIIYINRSTPLKELYLIHTTVK